MPFLDDERLRYPYEYINMVGGKIANLKAIEDKPDLLTFTFTSHVGFSIFCQARTELVAGIKEGTIKSGAAEGIIKFAISDDRNLSTTRMFLTVEEWENVVIE